MSHTPNSREDCACNLGDGRQRRGVELRALQSDTHPFSSPPFPPSGATNACVSPLGLDQRVWMGPGAHGLRGATAAGRVVVVYRPPVGTVTAPGQPSGPSPNSEAAHSIHHPQPHLSPLSPAPSRPTIGGKYCLGERRRHRSCNTDVSSPWCCPSCPSLLPHPPCYPSTSLSSCLQTVSSMDISSLP